MTAHYADTAVGNIRCLWLPLCPPGITLSDLGLTIKYAYEHLPVIITTFYPKNFSRILIRKGKIHLEMINMFKHFSLPHNQVYVVLLY